MEEWTIYLIAGIIVVTFSLLRYNIKRRRREVEEFARRRAAAQAARETAEKKQKEMGQPVKIKVGSLKPLQSERVPLPDAVETTFAASVTPPNIARWETEIHEIGRQITGKIDSKMVALQTLTLEANRAANRLELLLEQLEKIVKTQIIAKETVADLTETEIQTGMEVEQNIFSIEQNSKNEKLGSDVNNVNLTESQNIISADQRDLDTKVYADLLSDLESEIENLSEDMKSITYPDEVESASVTVLKAEKLDAYQKMSDEAVLPSKAVNDGTLKDSFSLSSPSLPGGLSISPSNNFVRSERPNSNSLREPLSLNSLYDNELAERVGEKVFAVAGVVTGVKEAENPRSATGSITMPITAERASAGPTSTRQPIKGSHLYLRKEVEMMSDYGHTPRQIAQSLDITVDEVDLMLSLRD